MTRLKICGLRQADHALAARKAGADFLGFNFVPGVRRQLSEEAAREVIEDYRRRSGDGGPSLVGLFANQALEEVNKIVETCRLDFAQLCGDEPPEYWQRVSARVIKQIKVRQDGPKSKVIDTIGRRLDEVVSRGHLAVLDTYLEGALGGTGRTFDWSIARSLGRSFDFLLAGGLSPENVEDAIGAAAPWGVDVSSGVETDGVKDPAKIAAFALRAREASADSPRNPSRATSHR